MDKQQAKKILALYRPGSDDADDPQFAAALGLARRDPELQGWLEEHCANYVTVRTRLRQINVPAELRENILAEHAVRSGFVWWRQPALLAAAAGVVLLITLSVFWLRPREHNSFSAYRDRMIRTAIRDYRMDLVTTNLTAIRQYLANNQGLADYTLPAPLEQLPGDGCKVLSWHGKPVSMVCFDRGGGKDFYLFIAQRSAMSGAPVKPPQLTKVSKLMTAGWSEGDKVYLLVGEGDEDFVRKFL